ncbi:hypothetical protein HMPREF1421_00093 [Helicobacter pylori GAM265BSii]|uniref:Uncharacterized protein n=1 Tax=Helicobacter pylori GAM265BSii TaxID=1159049 RepID=M3RI15_HELPX|nr:hypothetical protein HMPREF1421_00093 [Helicobacter pylori GAM265BSii]
MPHKLRIKFKGKPLKLKALRELLKTKAIVLQKLRLTKLSLQ